MDEHGPLFFELSIKHGENSIELPEGSTLYIILYHCW